MAVPAFFIDRTPVTRAAYAAYLKASKYTPDDTTNFLANWTRQDTMWVCDPADVQKPVTHVSLTEAREFCAFYGRRLPHSWEWQLAAQGLDGRLFPWGDNANASSALDGTRCPPYDVGTSGDDQAGLRNVTAFPDGASPYGVLDMVGNVWQFTDEFIDEHGRAVVLRGGSHYLPCCDPAVDTCPSGAECKGGVPEARWGSDWCKSHVVPATCCLLLSVSEMSLLRDRLPQRPEDAPAQHARSLSPDGGELRARRHDRIPLRRRRCLNALTASSVATEGCRQGRR
jgi:hypothetical protein